MLSLEDARYYATEIVTEVGPEFRYGIPEKDGTHICLYVPLPEARVKGLYDEEPKEGDPREQTGCLIGRILDRAGETVHRDPRVTVSDNVNDLDTMFPTLFEDGIVRMYLVQLQESQDEGSTWIDAVTAGEMWLQHNAPVDIL